jgi:tellurite resistance protein TehA-like permease
MMQRTEPAIAHEPSRIATLFPGYFALVMATGIVAIAAQLRGFGAIAAVLLVIAAIAYVVLWVLTGARVARYPSRFVADLTSHQRGAGFLTVVAATNVLGSAFLVTGGLAPALWRRTTAETLWFVGLVLWIALLYAFVVAVTIDREKPSLDAGIGGVWLLLVVATESVAVLGARVTALLHADWILFTAVVTFCIGAMLYIVIIGLIFYRWTFFPMGSLQLTPPYWINMGALAIATLAGSLLLQLAPTSALVAAIQPFVVGMTILFWAFATWWIPILVAVGVWRHVIQRVRLSYDPQYWAMVFPLGMYATCTAVMLTAFRAVLAVDLSFLSWVSPLFFWVALASWVVVFVAMAASLWPSRSAVPART